jgi:hypothetical protein
MPEMALQTTLPLRIGKVFEISFPTFTPRITLDFISGEAFTAVTPAKGEFMRLRGRIQTK